MILLGSANGIQLAQWAGSVSGRSCLWAEVGSFRCCLVCGNRDETLQGEQVSEMLLACRAGYSLFVLSNHP